MFELVKHWDVKLVTLRKDLDIEGVYKRLDTMIETYKVTDIVDKQKTKHKKLKAKLSRFDTEMAKVRTMKADI